MNQVADYIAADTANQRESVIRAAKFPRKAAVIPYSEGKRTGCGFLARNSGDVSELDEDIARLRTRLAREPDGWKQSEIRRNIACLEQLKEAFPAVRAKRFRFGIGPVDMSMRLEDVRINTRLDLTVTETDSQDVTFSGGCVLVLASTQPARRKLDVRQKLVAALIHWNLQDANQEPREKLCLSFDVFGNSLVTAPTAIDRLRSNVRTSCREAANSWDGVAPPAGYDGPDWR